MDLARACVSFFSGTRCGIVFNIYSVYFGQKRAALTYRNTAATFEHNRRNGAREATRRVWQTRVGREQKHCQVSVSVGRSKAQAKDVARVIVFCVAAAALLFIFFRYNNNNIES